MPYRLHLYMIVIVYMANSFITYITYIILLILLILPITYRNQVGLYRDDGLGAFENSPQCLERIKKQICKVFKDNGLKITIDANKKIVNFLDVTLDLNKGTHEPYLKPNNKPLYVHNESNHPPSIIKNIPLAINKRLNELSSNKESFDKASPEKRLQL